MNDGVCSPPAPPRPRTLPDNGGSAQEEDPFKAEPEWQRRYYPDPGSEPYWYPWPQPNPQQPQPKPKPRRGSGECQTYGSQTDFQIGDQAYIDIQAWFRRHFGFASTRTEFTIPGSGPNGGFGSADAVLLDEGIRWGRSEANNYAGIYEIKPRGQFYSPVYFQLAVDQRNRYIANFYKSEVGGTAVAGTIWEPRDELIGVWSLDPQQQLYVTSYYLRPNAEGLIYYYCQ